MKDLQHKYEVALSEEQRFALLIDVKNGSPPHLVKPLVCSIKGGSSKKNFPTIR